MRCSPAAGDSRRLPTLRDESSRCSRRVLPLTVKAEENVPGIGGQLARKGAHDVLSEYAMQELGLAIHDAPRSDGIDIHSFHPARTTREQTPELQSPWSKALRRVCEWRRGCFATPASSAKNT